ncbi:Xaa-Pro peptidase family protein [Emcibacter sp. SYSU 3D8]|uniref:M24 family metallopeptidase n=1 Tax=Emcibacter sp. SYSU 3D8 TaxID=3133969 RepID=UPI0031FF41EC
MKASGIFQKAEFDLRVDRVRALMAQRGMDACLIASPENIYYLTGLDHQGYFASQLLIVPMEGKLALVTRAMERAVVRDMVPDLIHIGYQDGATPLPPPTDSATDIIMASQDQLGQPTGLRPWETSAGVVTRDPRGEAPRSSAAAEAIIAALLERGWEEGRLGLEENSSFLTFRVAREVAAGLPRVDWQDCSGLIEDCRLIQSPAEQKFTRSAAEVSDAMMLSAIAAAGAGVAQKDVMAAVYQAMFHRGGTYPGFIPLVRSTRTIEHEHGTWQDDKLRNGELLFLEMAGCVRRYHAPMGRLVFIGRAPKTADRMLKVCEEAIEAAADAIQPGVKAKDVYAAWHAVLSRHGLDRYRRHHCGYAVGIGFPPSWSGSGVPIGLRETSNMELRPGMVFHLMSWLLRTGRGDSFLSDTVVVTSKGCERLTRTPRALTVR